VLWTTANGVALFGDCQDAFGLIDRESISLLLTSPPYPLLTQKAYSNIADETAYIDWMLRLAETWTDRLRPDGSLVLNIGDVWEKGRPSLSLYQERLLIRLHDELGLRLAQRFAWFKPAALPAPAEWVTIRRIRVKPALETVLWLSKSDFPYADNRQVLVPYSESMKRAIAGGGQAAATKPSGYRMEEGAFSRDNGGSIPTNLLTAANTASSDIYMRRCRSAGLPIHPARFPAALAQFFIPLTTRKEDLVVDPFAGSFTVARVAESLGRRWIGSEQVLEYAMGGRLRFEDHELTG
jgi:site-specific DNA-methyltransferase (cytosine-N4-specific)